jgi:hypothetical protein
VFRQNFSRFANGCTTCIASFGWKDVTDKTFHIYYDIVERLLSSIFPLSEEKSNGMTLGDMYLLSMVGLFAVP